MAKWIKAEPKNNWIYSNAYRQCSDCNEVVYMPLEYRYCPMCGTTMEKPKSRNYNDFEN